MYKSGKFCISCGKEVYPEANGTKQIYIISNGIRVEYMCDVCSARARELVFELENMLGKPLDEVNLMDLTG